MLAIQSLFIILLQLHVGSGCVDGETESSAGILYNVYCGENWSGNDLNYYADVNNLSICINDCDTWNTQSQPPLCVGVSLVLYPPGAAGCYLKSQMAGLGYPQNNASLYLVDSAKDVKLVSPQSEEGQLKGRPKPLQLRSHRVPSSLVH